ncbi:WXG100 family type VII secretion target [Streptomyces lydicamycinicus]|uniref:WXG100 family type VII secretion target n=1 Tax=Streptomyces lydicamycinicus TaxID=1546107 RepID=UPI0020363DDC|nr:WXG100 family type VII secretion target [Streptomyces lydicamycinicus]USA01375.1 WXG100 family type VII secretion target [Streptomyces lydicamycinicus]
MSGDESVAEEIVELGIEIVHPGGRPDELREAAKQWRHLKSEVDRIFGALDKQVNAVVGHTWRGEAAEAFQEHWNECKKAVDPVTANFDEAAEGLEKAAKAIEEVNEEIEDIYIEIGISVGVSIGMSFLTLGVSAAVGTARVAMLAKRALDAAGRLGRMLRLIARVYRGIKGSRYLRPQLMQRGVKALEGFTVNTASGTAGGVATSVLSGKGPEWGTNLMGGIGGATVGTGAGKLATALGRGDFVSGAVGGAAGGVTGDVLDSYRKGEDLDGRQTAITAVTGGAAGGVGGSVRGFDREMDRMARDIKMENRTPGSHEANMDTAWGTVVPIAGGVSGNEGKDGFEDVDKSTKDGRTAAEQGTKGRNETTTDEVRDVFG